MATPNPSFNADPLRQAALTRTLGFNRLSHCAPGVHAQPKLELIEDKISRKLAEAERKGELRSAPSFGKPLAADAGWDMTPDELKMPFKILRNAGIVPPEVELFHERARLREALQSAPDEGQRQVLRKQLTDLEQRLSLRLEALQRSGAL